MTSLAPARLLRVPSTLPPGWRRALLWGGATVTAGVAAAVGAGPLLVLGIPFLGGCLLGLLGEPLAFLWILVVTSGFTFAWLEGAALHIGGNRVNLTGLHWGLIAVVSSAILLKEWLWPSRLRRREGAEAGAPSETARTPAPAPHLGGDGTFRLPGALKLYSAFVGLTMLGVTWAPDAFVGVKYAVQFATPLLVAMVTLLAVRDQEDLERLRLAFWIGLALGVGSALASDAATVLLDGGIGIGRAVNNRSFAIYLLPPLALALAGWRHRRPELGLLVVGIIALTPLTLSRMGLLSVAALLVLTSTGRPLRGRVAAAGVAVAAMALAIAYDPLRERIFADPRVGFTGLRVTVSGSGADAGLSIGGLQLTGRGLLWLQTWLHAIQAPVLGHGTGSAEVLLQRTLRLDSAHPHNDYLRLFHDLGAVGLALGLAFVGGVFLWVRRLHQRAQGALSRELALAALLAWSAYALMPLTDNAMVYVGFFTQNVFLLIAMAVRARELEASTAVA